MNRWLTIYLVCSSVLAAQAAVAQDYLGLSFAADRIATADTVAAGSSVAIHLVAFVADPTDGVVSFSCRMDWDRTALRDLTWQEQVESGRDGLVSATFARPRFPQNGCVVLATAVATVTASDTTAVWLIGTPAVAGTVSMGRDLPLGDRPGRTLGLLVGEAPGGDPGPPGPPGGVVITD